ncbi:MAG: peptidase dimerization domain-containing protein [Thermomicrobiales bacterium]
MDDPFSGKVGNARDWGHDEPAVFGQGVSQNKAHQAVMLAVLKLLREQDVTLRGRLYWAINNEGRSSHACSEAILASIPEIPTFGIVQIGTGLALSLGNRGWVDVDVHVQGVATHSSVPNEGLSALDGAHTVIERLKRLTWPDRHPLLGGRHAIVYKVRYEPVAPHTLPSDAFLAVDRRLLPGDDPDAATDEVRAVIGDLAPYRVTVMRGVMMLPALVPPDDPGVRMLQAANVAVRGPCALGVPTVMYGASGDTRLTGTDFVPIAAVETEANVLTHMILDYLG